MWKIRSFDVHRRAMAVAICSLLAVLAYSEEIIDPQAPDATPPQVVIDGMRLVWNDEFDAVEGKPDSTKWKFETGFQRNHEDQWYQADNAYLDGRGNLIIEGRKERVENPAYQAGSDNWRRNRQYAEYTSASIQSKFVYRYGRLLVRAKLPAASGAWPAIWQVGTQFEWPLGGEIDIMEYYPSHGEPALHANYCWGTDVRWNGKWQSRAIPLSHFTEKDPRWMDKYHVWRLDWDADSLRIYVDDELLNEISTAKTLNGSGGGRDGGYVNPFSNDIEGFANLIWLNLALGGDNGGKIDNAAFPMRYYVDYVRLYQK